MVSCEQGWWGTQDAFGRGQMTEHIQLANSSQEEQEKNLQIGPAYAHWHSLDWVMKICLQKMRRREKKEGGGREE